MKSTSKGFTLLEIIVVMLIISISGSLVFMSLGKGAGKKEIKIFAGKMASLCRRARMTALASSTPVMFIISPINRQCWISRKDNEQSDTINGQNNNGKAYILPIPGRVFIEASGLTKQDNGLYKIIFYPDGSSSGGDLSIGAENKPVFFCRIDLLTGIISMSQNDHGRSSQ